MSEGETPPGPPTVDATRHPVPWWSKIGLGFLLTIGVLGAAYFGLQALGLGELRLFVWLPLLLIIMARFNHWASGLGDQAPESREDVVRFSAPYRQVGPGVVTDDMSIKVPASWTTEQLVEFVLAAAKRGAPRSEVVSALVASGFLEDDVGVAIDRTLGGLFRSRFRTSAKRPSRAKDPIAWMSYHYGRVEPGLVDAIFPASSPEGNAPAPALEWVPSEMSAFQNMTVQGAYFDKAKALVAARLSIVSGTWTISSTWTVERGRVLGPGGLSVLVSKDRCGDGSTGGLLLGFVVPRAWSEPVVLWDCAHGAGETEEDVLRTAVDVWAGSTAPVGLELHHQRGEFADHFHGAYGLPGWHVIHGPFINFGEGEGARSLKEWVLAHPLLPQLAGALEAAGLPVHGPTGMKLFFGSSGGKDIAEVRVNHVVHPELSSALAGLSWPRSEDPAYARVFVLFVHPE